MASTAPQDNGGSLRKSIGLIELFTFWTCEPIRPAQAFQIGSAGGIIGKNPLKIGKRCWKAAEVHSGKLSPIHRIGNKPDRQGLDHVVVFGERHLRHLLLSYMAYYNSARTHLSLNNDAPLPRAVQAIGRILPTPILGGLPAILNRVESRDSRPA